MNIYRVITKDENFMERGEMQRSKGGRFFCLSDDVLGDVNSDADIKTMIYATRCHNRLVMENEIFYETIRDMLNNIISYSRSKNLIDMANDIERVIVMRDGLDELYYMNHPRYDVRIARVADLIRSRDMQEAKEQQK